LIVATGTTYAEGFHAIGLLYGLQQRAQLFDSPALMYFTQRVTGDRQ
jgi:hypothetical protein